LQAYGRWQPYTDAGPVRDHLLALSSVGIGWKRAAELSGVSTGAVSKLLFGGPGNRAPAKRVRPETAAAILAVPAAPSSLSAGSLVSAAGTRRRLQALVAIGWPQSQLAARLGVQPGNLGSMLAREHVRAGTARAVEILYDQLWSHPPSETDHRSRISASRARSYAQARGWPPPMAWDDDLIDDPAATPEPGWQRSARSSRRAAELAEDAEELRRQGYSRQLIAERLGVTHAALEKAISRAARLNPPQPDPAAVTGASEQHASRAPAGSRGSQDQRGAGARAIQAQLAASVTAPRQARAAIRQALADWGLGAITADAELLASELVANAAEHGSGRAIGLVLRERGGANGRPGIACEVADSSPLLPQIQPVGPDSERGRGLTIVGALATASGVTTGPRGKTAWFTLDAPSIGRHARQAEPEAEASA